MNKEEAIVRLKEKYLNIGERKGREPEWAVHKKYEQERIVRCSIPFIGEKYFEQPIRILVYASAEVLNDYYPGGESERPWLDDDSIAIDRHNWFFDNMEKQENRFFPNMHIQPINDGALLTAVGYIMSKLHLVEGNVSPYDVCEMICAGNYSKYTVETEHQKKLRTGIASGDSKANIDTADKKVELFESRDYIRTDLEILQPNYIVMPEGVYNTEKVFIDGILEQAKIIPICQMNSRVINMVIHRWYSEYSVNELPEAIKNWYSMLGENGITGKTKQYYLSVFTYLDKILKSLV